MDRQKGSGSPWTATACKNEEAIEDLVCSQEDQPGTHMHPMDIAKELDISNSPIHRIIKTEGIKQFKRFKTFYINYATGTRLTLSMFLFYKIEDFIGYFKEAIIFKIRHMLSLLHEGESCKVSRSSS